jgi:hypothetical protein
MYGYFPLARYVRLRPAATTPHGFAVDRGALPAVYNQYPLTRRDPFYLTGREEVMLVFRPLVLTGILLDDFIAEGHDWFGADAVVIASASSKTSIGLAYMLAKRPGRAPIALTSARNAPFVEKLGLYSRVVTYDEISDLSANTPAVFVDVAGDARVRTAVARQLGANLKAAITVGRSHWDQTGGVGTVQTAENSVPFFAPGWVERRREDWGPAALSQRITGAWHEFMREVDRWVHVVTGTGRDTVAATYDRMVGGLCAPDQAQVLSLWDGAFAKE